MILPFVVAVAVAVLIFFLKSTKAASKDATDVFPVTIIQGGKAVTFNGLDDDRREKEFTTALAHIEPAPTHEKRESDPHERMTVAITGALCEPRAQVAIKINSTRNARFVDRVFLDTDYLVATRKDTAKSRAAGQNGTIIISEQQLFEYLGKGEFPRHRRRETHSSFNFNESEIEWADTHEPPVRYELSYVDRDGEISERVVEVLHLAGAHPNGNEYLAAFDEGELKTFRRDRVLKLERLK